MGKYRNRLLAVQQSEERAYAGRGRHEIKEAARETAMESRHHHHHRYS